MDKIFLSVFYCETSNYIEVSRTSLLDYYVYAFLSAIQAKLSISGKDFWLTLIARRSRHYAGTRYHIYMMIMILWTVSIIHLCAIS